MRLPRIAVALSLAACLPATLTAQWSKDAAASEVLSAGTGSAAQPKIRTSGEPWSYVSWFESDPAGTPAFGFDVRLQRLDPFGRGLWGAGGILVADRGFSSTQDYGLDAAPNGDAWLAFRDDRLTGVQITATRVDADGVQVFGSLGVQLTNTAAFVAAPRVAATANGGAVVAWTQDGSVRLQRLDASGAAVGAQLTLPSAGSTTLSDLRADGDAVIVSWVEQIGGFFAPRHLFAQKLSASNTPLWGAGVTLFDTGSLQIANTPAFALDGSGGAVFAWYGVSPLQSYAQHVLADGTLAFGPGGAQVSTNGAQIRVSPSADFDASSGDTYVFWTEQNASQSLSGVRGQRLDAAGNRLWTDFGTEVVAVGSNGITSVNTVAGDGQATVLWLQTPVFGSGTARGVTLTSAAALAHPITDVATTPASVSRLNTVAGPLGDAFAAWSSDSGTSVIVGQNLISSGAIGPAAGSLTRTEGSNLETYSASVGPLGGTLAATVDLSSTGHALAFVFAYLAPASIPFGTEVILVDFTGPELLSLPPSAGPLAAFSVPIPTQPIFCGLRLATQAVHVDAVLEPRLTNAVDWYLGL